MKKIALMKTRRRWEKKYSNKKYKIILNVRCWFFIYFRIDRDWKCVDMFNAGAFGGINWSIWGERDWEKKEWKSEFIDVGRNVLLCQIKHAVRYEAADRTSYHIRMKTVMQFTWCAHHHEISCPYALFVYAQCESRSWPSLLFTIKRDKFT